MKQETSQWGKAVKKAVIDHDMTLKQLAEKIGYSNATVSQVVNGRYSNSSYKVIAEKINEVLGTEGLPERTETPSDMAGGNILYTSDSRFKQITGISYPIAIHDRYEGR